MARELAYSWGVFQVNSDSIFIEKWISSDEFGGYPTIKYSGKVIDDNKIICISAIAHNLEYVYI